MGVMPRPSLECSMFSIMSSLSLAASCNSGSGLFHLYILLLDNNLEASDCGLVELVQCLFVFNSLWQKLFPSAYARNLVSD